MRIPKRKKGETCNSPHIEFTSFSWGEEEIAYLRELAAHNYGYMAAEIANLMTRKFNHKFTKAAIINCCAKQRITLLRNEVGKISVKTIALTAKNVRRDSTIPSLEPKSSGALLNYDNLHPLKANLWDLDRNFHCHHTKGGAEAYCGAPLKKGDKYCAPCFKFLGFKRKEEELLDA